MIRSIIPSFELQAALLVRTPKPVSSLLFNLTSRVRVKLEAVMEN